MDIDLAILHLGKNNNFYRHDGTKITYWGKCDPDDLENPDTEPTQAELEAAHAEWKIEWDAQEYARKRKPEYPSIEECVHAILDDDLVALQAKRSAVKAKYPK